MNQLNRFALQTEIKMFQSTAEFIEQMNISAQDLLVTNEPIYKPVLASYNLKCRVIFQEKYGSGEPNDRMINAIIQELDGYSYSRVLAIGGGTVIDVAKVLALSGVKNVLDALYGKVPLQRERKLVIIPTTCGTGSEVTNIAILEDTQAHVKKGIVGKVMYPDEAVLVPDFLKALPYKFFAFSSIDALIHAIESFLSPASNLFTEMFAIEAMRTILSAYQDIINAGTDTYLKHIGQVLVASTCAGIAFSNTGVGAVHALSYPLGGKYHVAHGEANYAFLGAVLAKYEEYNPQGKIVELKRILSSILQPVCIDDTFSCLAEILNQIIPLKYLREYGVQENELQEFTNAAMQQERLMKNNYVPLNQANVFAMYLSRY